MHPRALLSVAVLLAFGASATHGFHFDDYSLIHGPAWTAWQTRPVTWASFLVNSRVSSHPALWHLVNLAAHLGAVLLLYELFLTRLSPSAALLGAAVFAVAPIQAESVAYVYSRATLFSTAFSIATCLLWVRNRRWWAVGVFALALLSKEDCATVPLVILLFEAAHGRAGMRKKLVPMGAMLLLAGFVAIATLQATLVTPGSGAGFSAGVSPGSYLLDQGFVILRYLRLVIVPYGFTIDPEIHVSPTAAIASWAVLAGLAALAARDARNNLWFVAGLILLIPSSSVVPLADLAADHRMYLPMAAFAAGAGLWLARLPRFGGLAVILLLIGLSAGRMSVWASDKTLWTEAVERAPGKLRPRIQLARAVEPPQALEVLMKAAAMHPGDVDVNQAMGRVYLQMGQPQLALAEFGQVLGRRPDDAHAMNNRGAALLAMGQNEAAKQDFERALKKDPCLAEARQNLGLPPCSQ